MSIEEGLEMSLAKVCMDRDSLTAQVDGLQRALAQSQASAQGLAVLAESLQDRLASRPLTGEDTNALEADNAALTARVAELESSIRTDNTATLKAAEARIAELEKSAARYRWMQEWYFRDGQRKEIDPHGHIRQTTVEIMDAAIDAALSGADSGKPEGAATR